MLYAEFINKAMEVTITQADNGLFYLEPLWTTILLEHGLDIEKIADYETDYPAVLNVLKLEVKKRNTSNSLLPYVLNWIHDIITASVEPAIMQEETDYIKNLTEYLKTNNEAQRLKDKEDWDKFKNT